MSSTNDDDDLAFLEAMNAIGLASKGHAKKIDDDLDAEFLRAMGLATGTPAEASAVTESGGLAPPDETAADWSVDDAMFEAAMSGAPLPERSVALPAKPKGPAGGARPHGNNDKLKRKLAKGKIAAGAKLDLHGKTKDKAFEELNRFLTSAQSNDHNMVQIVFGRGNNSKDGAVLRPAVLQWLKTEFPEIVQQLIPAPRNQGGEGACYVLVRKRHQ